MNFRDVSEFLFHKYSFSNELSNLITSELRCLLKCYKRLLDERCSCQIQLYKTPFSEQWMIS